MAKHSFVSDENSFRKLPREDPRFVSDHKEPEIQEILYVYGHGPITEVTRSRLSTRIAKWGIIPLAFSIIIGILLLFRVPVDDVVMKSVFTLTGAFFGNALIIYLGENSAVREIKNWGKAKKNWLPLAAWLGLPGFILIPIGLFWYSSLGIFSGIFVFVGSVMTLTSFILINNAERSDKRFGLRELMMTLIFLPAIIAFFGFFGILAGFFAQFA